MSDPRRGPKVGVLVPFTNTNLEPDLALLSPPSVTFHYHRMGGYDVDEIPGSEQMSGLGAADLSESLTLISGVRPRAVLYGCTSATLAHGAAFDRDLARRISARTGAVAITAAGALAWAIRSVGAKRIGFASPYLGEVNDQAIGFLATHDITTARRADIGRELGNYGQGELSPVEVHALALEADAAEVDAIVLSCTDMRAVEVIDALETVTGKPVITSNQAMVAALCTALDLPRPQGRFGRLFRVG